MRPVRCLILSALSVLLVAAAAFAGTLPAAGTWVYDNSATVKSTPGHASITAYVRISDSERSVTSFDGIVIGGKCRKGGHVSPAGTIGFSMKKNKVIEIGTSGRFSATRKAVGDATGVKGSVKVKGVIEGTKLSGKVTAHLHNPNFGDCRGSGKFSRAKGEQVG